jgi:metallo-beta-lactamase class B
MKTGFKPKLAILCSVVFLFSILSPSIARDLKRVAVNRDIEYILVNPHTYILISYADLPGIGRLGTNHLLYIKNKRAFLFDTPNDNALAGELYHWVKDSLKAEITSVSVSHWHKDHSGGLDTLNKLGIKSYSYFKTKDQMLSVGLSPAQTTFTDSVTIDFDGTKILLAFYGAAHTNDNTIAWIENEKILFSGSIIRSLDNFNLGYLKDADVKAWHKTVENIRNRFGSAVLIIPGHGDAGGTELIEHTVMLARPEYNH